MQTVDEGVVAMAAAADAEPVPLCDQCHAADAWVRCVSTDTGRVLWLCHHHWLVNRAALAGQGWDVWQCGYEAP